MQKTENYQLCHWVASDRVLMEDFNSDNTKLEAALTGLAAADAAEQNARAAQDTALAQQISQLAASVPIVKLLDQAVTSEQTRLDIDMSPDRPHPVRGDSDSAHAVRCDEHGLSDL